MIKKVQNIPSLNVRLLNNKKRNFCSPVRRLFKKVRFFKFSHSTRKALYLTGPGVCLATCESTMILAAVPEGSDTTQQFAPGYESDYHKLHREERANNFHPVQLPMTRLGFSYTTEDRNELYSVLISSE